MSMLICAVIALIIDRIIGWPERLFQRISHPVVAIGHLISWCDKTFNKTDRSSSIRRISGIITVIIVAGVCLLVALIISHFIPEGVFGIILTSLLIWPWIAAKSLSDHVIKVAVALAASDLNAARSAVSMIVGRNAKTLDNFGIARASLESLAENTSDGVVAPLFWTVIFGLPGLFVYKAINTMDSMIGYRTQNYEAFGWAAAKLDDLANFLPARLTGLLFALTATKPIYSMSIMWRDAGKHRSPNAGWPESGFAAALNIQLSGPRDYEGTRSSDKWLHEEGRNPTEKDIVLGLKHYNRLLNWLIVVAFALLVLFWLNKAGY